MQRVIDYFSDFPAIRGDFIPSSADHGKLNAHKGLCNTLEEYFTVLGLAPQELAGFNIGDITSSSNTILLPYKSLRNQKAASCFEEIVSDMSPFISWAIKNVDGFRTNNSDFVTYSFPELHGYLCGLEDHLAPKGDDYLSGSIKIPEEWVLKHLIAATSGEVSLRKTDQEGVFTVVTTSSSEKRTSSTIPEIKIIVDASGSMSRDPIRQVNQWLPIVYEEIGKMVKYPVNLRLFSFSEDLKPEYGFTIHPRRGISNNYTDIESFMPYTVFPDITVRSGTDLSYIGNMIISDVGGVVIAFSDGMHGSSTSLSNHYQILEQKKGSNPFAYPVTCVVGSGIDTSYFEKVQSIFGGKTFSASDVLSFFGEIRSAAKDILSPRVSLILTLNGVDVTDWVLDKAGIQNVGKVSRGDKVVLNGIEYEIDPEV